MINSIDADLLCPEKQEISKDAEIQIKWQHLRSLTLNGYHQGDVLEDIEDEYDNPWIRTDYICRVCSRHTTGRYGISYIKVADQILMRKSMSIRSVIPGIEMGRNISQRCC